MPSCCPILEQIDVSREMVQAVITAPTRELAMQLNISARCGCARWKRDCASG
ncbi:MAG: hypothetical protein V8T10_01025 [Merdibacter sp.]